MCLKCVCCTKIHTVSWSLRSHGRFSLLVEDGIGWDRMVVDDGSTEEAQSRTEQSRTEQNRTEQNTVCDGS